MEQPALLEMRGICKEFPGVKALDNVNLTVRPGTVHALMGENGAGKSTLMKCLFGIYHKDAGTIKLDGKEVNFRSSKEALENGVAPEALTGEELENVRVDGRKLLLSVLAARRMLSANVAWPNALDALYLSLV